MRVAELWRYPVKSLLGERLGTARIGPDGIEGDRHWALFDLDTGLGLTARRVPELLFAAARTRPGGRVEVVLPDGTATADDAVLSAWLGRPVALRAAAGDLAPRYEGPDDQLRPETTWHEWEGAARAFHDNPAFRVSLVSTGTVGTWDRRRFRANVVLTGEGEDALVGSVVRLGTARLDVGAPIDRCVMVTRPQAGGVARDTGVLKTVHRERGGTLAVGGTVRSPGEVSVGDAVGTGAD